MVEALEKTTSSKVQQLLKSQHAHILYMYQDDDSYINQVLSYVEGGIAEGEYVLLIENERNYNILKEKLTSRLTAEEINRVQYVNSLNFYLSTGSYYPPAILAYFQKMIQWFVDNEIPFRTWAHVEWETLSGASHLIEQIEKIVDQAVQQLPFSLICAYEKNRISHHLHEVLLQCHPYVLDENGLNKSEKYTLEYP